MMINSIKIFEEKEVRTLWDEKSEKWFVSIIDVIEVLTDSDRPRKYWSDLKSKLKKEGSEMSEKIGHLKMKASDGKMRFTDVASQCGSMAKVAREALELKTGKKVVTKLNAKSILQEQKKLESEDDE